jgi:group I intron endonuclease
MVKTGIYKILCTANNKFYIGSSIDIYKRFVDHKYKLKRRLHSNTHLQRAWDKYGNEKFTLSILEECSREMLIEREQYWIDRLTPHIDSIGFNLIQYACPGYARFKKFIITYPDGHEETIENLSQFCRDHGLERRLMNSCCSNKERSHLGYKCRRYNQTEWKHPSAFSSKIKNWESDDNYYNKFWLIIYPNGLEQEVKNLAKFCRENQLQHAHMCKVANGEISNHKKFKCYRRGNIVEFNKKDKNYYWKIYYPNGEIESVNDLKDFAEKHNLCYSTLRITSKGIVKYTKGFRCKKIERSLDTLDQSGIVNYEENKTKTS